jgi:hypothetical protein
MTAQQAHDFFDRAMGILKEKNVETWSPLCKEIGNDSVLLFNENTWEGFLFIGYELSPPLLKLMVFTDDMRMVKRKIANSFRGGYEWEYIRGLHSDGITDFGLIKDWAEFKRDETFSELILIF